MANNTTVQLEFTRIGSALIRVDVKVTDAPADLFGIAFDLVISGGDWTLKNYEAGELFNVSGSPPLIAAVEKPEGGVGAVAGVAGAGAAGGSHKIVCGLSLKRGVSLESADGNLITFFIKSSGGNSLKFSFANNVLSSLRDGKRLDLKDVVWKGAEIKSGQPALPGALPGADAQVIGGTQVLGSTRVLLAQTNLLGGSRDDSLPVLWWEDPVAQVYLFMGIALAVMILVIFALVLAKKIKFN